MRRKPSFVPHALAGLLLAGLLTGVGAGPMAHAQSLKTARLLPDRTAILLWIPDAPDASRRFMNTAPGRILRDPRMQPLFEEFRDSLSESMKTGEGGIGLSLDELFALPHGEVSLAVVAPEAGPPTMVVLIDTGDDSPNAKRLLDRIAGGGEWSEMRLLDTRLIILEATAPGKSDVIIFEKDGTLVVGWNMEVLKQVLAAWHGQEAPSLTKTDNFRAIMRLSREHNPKPQFVWYVDPIMLLRSMGRENPGIQIALAMFPVLGLDGLKVFGGGIEWDAGQLDGIIHMHLLLRSPRSSVLEVLAFRSGDTTPESWVPADVSTYTTMLWDIEKAFDALRETFDTFRGEGSLSRMLKQWIEEPVGLDVEKDLLPALTGRVTRVTRFERPVTTRRVSSLLALELKKGAELSRILANLFHANEKNISRLSFSGKTYYRYSPPRSGELDAAASSPTEPCFGLLDGCLIVTDRESMYQAAITTAAGSADRLADSPDFKLIADKIRERSGESNPAMIRFARPEENMRSIYDLVAADQTRQLVKRQAENSIFSKALNAGLESQSLPSFDALRSHFAPGGGLLMVDDEGIHYTGITSRPRQD